MTAEAGRSAAGADPFLNTVMQRLGSAVLPISAQGGPVGTSFLLDEVAEDLPDGRQAIRTWLVTATALTATDVVTLHVPRDATSPPAAVDAIDMLDQAGDWHRAGPVAIKHFGGLEAHAERKGWTWARRAIQRGATEPTPVDSAPSGRVVATGFRRAGNAVVPHMLDGRTDWLEGVPQIPQSLDPETLAAMTGAPIALLRPWQDRFRLVCVGLLVPDGPGLRVEPMSSVFAAIADATSE